MNRRTTTGWMTAIALSLMLALTGCGSDDNDAKPKPTKTSDAAAADKAAALDAFDRYWAEKVVIANSGKVPKNALESTAIGPVREQDLARLAKDAKDGTLRTGAPGFKDSKATLQGESAVVITCFNDDTWPFLLEDGKTLSANAGWRQLARDLTKVDGQWLVTGYGPPDLKKTCA